MSVTEADIYNRLQTVFDGVFRRQDIRLTPELTAAEIPGWDSFRYVSFILAAEEQFAIKLPGNEIDELNNIGDLVRAIAKKKLSIQE